jgi:hypothetical protein
MNLFSLERAATVDGLSEGKETSSDTSQPMIPGQVSQIPQLQRFSLPCRGSADQCQHRCIYAGILNLKWKGSRSEPLG